MSTRMKRFSLHSAFYILSTVLLLAGCATYSTSKDARVSSPGMLEPQAILKFSDVPVPVGLKSIPLESYSFESSGVRVGVLKYQGKTNPEQIVNFYKEQMPMYNWNLINIVEYGQRLINFERENETCIITMTPGSWGNTVITISLGPKSQVTAKKSKQPLK